MADRDGRARGGRGDAGARTVAPRAAPFLFVGSERRDGDGLAGELEAVGLPVVAGASFQAPGYARLPFGGAAAASEALSRALGRWSELHAG